MPAGPAHRVSLPAAAAPLRKTRPAGRCSPLTTARRANLTGLKIYFDCGDQDDFGFETGVRALDKILSSRNIAHEAHIYPGRHDWQYFAEHLPASLEFQSRAIAK